MKLEDAVDAFLEHYDGEVGAEFTKDDAIQQGGKKELRTGETAESLLTVYASTGRFRNAQVETDGYTAKLNYNPSSDMITVKVGEGQDQTKEYVSHLEDTELQELARELEDIREEYGKDRDLVRSSI